MKFKITRSQVQIHLTQQQTPAHFPTLTRSACHSPPPPRSQDTLLQSARHHLLSLLRQVPTYPNAQLSEYDVQEFPAPPRATHHSPPQDLMSEPKFRVHLPLHLYLTSYSQALSTSLYHSQPFLPALRSILYYSKLLSLHPSTHYLIFTFPVSLPSRLIHVSLFFHCLFARHVQTIQGTPLCSPWQINLYSYSSSNFFIPDLISNCYTTCTSQAFHFHYIKYPCCSIDIINYWTAWYVIVPQKSLFILWPKA